MEFLLCIAVAVASLIAMRKAIEHQNVEAILMFFISLVCSATPMMAGRAIMIAQWGNPDACVDLITNLGIAGLVCFLLGLFFLFYPKGKNES